MRISYVLCEVVPIHVVLLAFTMHLETLTKIKYQKRNCQCHLRNNPVKLYGTVPSTTNYTHYIIGTFIFVYMYLCACVRVYVCVFATTYW